MKKNLKLITLTTVIATMILLGGCSTKETTNTTSSSTNTSEQLTKTDYSNIETTGDYMGSFIVDKNGVLAVGTDTSDKPIINIYFDPMCPGCGQYEREVGSYLNEEVQNDEIYIRYIPLMFLNSQSADNYSSRVSAYLLGVAEYKPELVSKFISAIFSEEFVPEEGSTTTTPTTKIDELFKSIGGDDESIKKINADLENNSKLTYNTTLQVMDSNKLRNQSPTGSLYTPFIVPYSKGEDDGTALSLNSGSLLTETKQAIDSIKK